MTWRSDCFSTSVDAFCVVSIVLLITTEILGFLLIRHAIKTEIVRFNFVSVLFAASMTITNYTGQPLMFLTRCLTVLIAIFTTLGMSTRHLDRS